MFNSFDLFFNLNFLTKKMKYNINMMVIYYIMLVLELFETNKVQIYCIINPKVEDKILKNNPQKHAHAYVHF